MDGMISPLCKSPRLAPFKKQRKNEKEEQQDSEHRRIET
jgi:hypothetical protein